MPRRTVAVAATGAVLLLTGLRLWPAEGVGPWADLVVQALPGDDPVPMLLHVVAAVVLLVLVATIPRARLATAVVGLALVSGYLMDGRGEGGWFAYTPQSGVLAMRAVGTGPSRWATVHALLLAPLAASAVGWVLARKPVEEPPDAHDVGAG